MEKYLDSVSEKIRRASKEPGNVKLKTKILFNKLQKQIDHVFDNSLFQINIFYGQSGMGKRSFVHSAIQASKFKNSIFFIEIDASFTRTEYLLLKEVFDTVEAESIVSGFRGDPGDANRKAEAKLKIKQWEDKGEKRTRRGAQKVSKIEEEESILEDSVYDDIEADGDEETFREIDEQDVASQYSKLHGYMSAFHIILYVQNADVFTRMKRQSFIYNILEMSKKHKAQGLVIFATEQLDFFESLEKRNASRMNPTKYVFGDFSYQEEFIKIIHYCLNQIKETEIWKDKPSPCLTMGYLLKHPAVQNQLQMCLHEDLTLQETLSFFRAFLRHLDPQLFVSFIGRSKQELKDLEGEDLTGVEIAFEQAKAELADTSKYETYRENLNFTEKLLLMIINKYQLTFQTQGSFPIRVKNLEGSIANYLRKEIYLNYKTSRDLIHHSIDNLERLGFLKISRKNMNLDTIVFGNIDPEFSEILNKDFKIYNLNSVRLNILDKK